MPKYNQRNKRGINFVKPAELVKSRRYTVKFTESEYEEIMEFIGEHNLERMAFSCEAILKAVRTKKKKKAEAAAALPSKADLETLREQGKTTGELAHQFNLSVQKLRQILGLD